MKNIITEPPQINCRPTANKQLKYTLNMGSQSYVFKDKEELITFLTEGLSCCTLKP